VKGTGGNKRGITGSGGVKTTRILSKNMTQKRGDMTTSKIRPIRAPFHFPVSKKPCQNANMRVVFPEVPVFGKVGWEKKFSEGDFEK
jgi:hypothetical protein